MKNLIMKKLIMKNLTAQSSPSNKRRRGTAMIEMLFVIPILLILIAFVVDLGMALYTKNTIADATQASVRVASQRGGAVLSGNAVARRAFEDAISGAPGVSLDNVVSYTVTPNVCTNVNSTVQARTRYTYSFITPGLNAMFRLAGGSGVGEGMVLEAASSLRCEIAWQ